MYKVRSTIFDPFTVQIHVKTSLTFLNKRRMVEDSKTGEFGNNDFSRKNQNFEWKTTLSLEFPETGLYCTSFHL